jgi:hypothetical protein
MLDLNAAVQLGPLVQWATEHMVVPCSTTIVCMMVDDAMALRERLVLLQPQQQKCTQGCCQIRCCIGAQPMPCCMPGFRFRWG